MSDTQSTDNQPSDNQPSDNDNQPGGTVMMLSGDLMFSSRVKSAAERSGFQFQMGGQLPTEETESIRYVIVDLSTRSGLIPTIVDQCSQRCPDARLIAYGPHVQVDKLSAARQAGVETVMTNGQFDASLATIFS